eukprot:m.333404 g.333404  ORF g.333404 m.333404 type:complete len:116 (+) comp17139_c0_seq1:115-462(+)
MTMRASHILVKHSGSRRLASWKDPEGEQIKARSIEQAKEILSGYRAQIVAKEKTFQEIAEANSDCGSAAQQGDLGEVNDGEMQAPFEAGLKKLAVGELSEIVETESGVHIILRTG